MSFYNSTLYAFSYRYGFISRGLLGTVYQWFDQILPFHLMSYNSLYQTSFVMTFIMYLFILLLCWCCLKKCRESYQHDLRLLICFMGVFTFPMFWTAANMGRIDIYFMICLMISLMLLVADRWIWLIVPLTAVSMCIHQGFTFTSANIVLALLFFRALQTQEETRRRKYGILFVLTFLVVSSLFLYFEFFSHTSGTDIAGELIANSKLLSESGKDYNETIVNHEILGKGVYEDEKAYHICNMQETPVFILFFWPYLWIAFTFFKYLLRGTRGKEKLAYLAVASGALTLVPELILKVDYGRYAFFTFFYYIVIVMVLIAADDERTCSAYRETKEAVKRKVAFPYFLIVYPMIFMPFSDWFITDVTLDVMDLIKLFLLKLS